MTQINWNQFTKKELVQVLEAMDERVWLVEPLNSENDAIAVKDCSCDVVVEQLPSQLHQVRANVLKRTSRPTPLGRLLRRSSRKRAG